jgi:ABC-2 type transport system permease protein/oleandomycin transport system permease protein
MTAAVVAPTAPAPSPHGLSRIRFGVSDALTLTRRNLLIWAKVPAFIVFTIVQPVMFTLLFRYVFGGAIPIGAGAHQFSYVEYLIPGIIGQTAGFACFGTAIALANELKLGLIDRLRAMPIARSAVLLGRLAADTFRMLITVLVLVGIGYAVGFRFHAGFGDAVAMILLATLLGLTFCTISATIGLVIKDEESVQAFGLIWVFPLTFVSSVFVPVQTMPGWLQAFANNQPLTQVTDTIRYLALGDTPVSHPGNHWWVGLLWMAGIMAVFIPLAVRAYRRA